MGERELIETVVDDWQKVAALQGNVLSIPKVYAASLVNDLLAALASRPAEAEGWVLVGSVVSAYGDPEAFGERRAEITADLMKLPYDTPLYALLSAAPKP